MKPIEFKAPLERFESSLWFYHIKVDKGIGDRFIEGKNKRIICTINRTETFQAALMPDGDGNYFININKQLRQSLNLNEFDSIHITISKDTSEYGLPIAEAFEELLNQDETGNKLFQSLTPGKKRTLLHIISKPRSADLRIRNGMVILQHLKNNAGKIEYKQLAIDMKNSL